MLSVGDTGVSGVRADEGPAETKMSLEPLAFPGKEEEGHTNPCPGMLGSPARPFPGSLLALGDLENVLPIHCQWRHRH